MPTEHRVAHRPAHQGELVARLAEPPAELVDHRRDPVQLRGHRLLHLGHLEGRQGGVGHERKLYRQSASRPPPRRRRTRSDGGYSRGHASPAVAAACPRGGGGDTLARRSGAGRGGRGRPTARDRPPRAERLRRQPRPGQDRTGPRPSRSATRSRSRSTRSPRRTSPTRGRSRSPGSVTNRSQDTWTAINLHAFMRRQPITTSAELAEAADARPDRVRRRPDHRRRHLRHASTSWSRVSRRRSPSGSRSRQITVSEPGRLLVRRARARRLRRAARRHRRRPGPHVPAAGRPTPRRPVEDRAGHPAAAPASSTTATAASPTSRAGRRPCRPAARCAACVDFGASAGSRPVSWLVDPAVPDAVRALVAGNPPALARRHASTRTSPATTRAASASPSPTEGPSDADAEGEDAGRRSHRPTNAATEPGVGLAEPARGRARRRRGARACRTATSTSRRPPQRDPEVYERARAADAAAPSSRGGSPPPPRIASAERLRRPGAPRRRAAASSTILVTDRMFPEGAPPVARVDGRRLTATSSVDRAGRPGPGDPLAGRRAAPADPGEAAVRAARPRAPAAGRRDARRTGAPSSTLGFFGGLDVDWLDLIDIDEISDRPRSQRGRRDPDLPRRRRSAASSTPPTSPRRPRWPPSARRSRTC